MPRHLPANPSLEHLKNQAKDLLKAIRAGDEDATRRFKEQLSQSKPAAGQRNLPRRFTLADAQLVIAHEYGFVSWPKLKAYVEFIAPAAEESKQKSPLQQKIKSAHWMETWHHYGKHPYSSTTEVWIRTDPPARAWINRSVPGPNVKEGEWSHHIRDER